MAYARTGIAGLLLVSAACSDHSPTAVRSQKSAIELAPASANFDQSSSAQVATGFVEISNGSADEKYSYVAVTNSGYPGTKGALAWRAVDAGATLEILADLDCLVIVGNEAWLSGPIRKFTFNGEPQPATRHVRFRVIDNGQGNKAAPDAASGMFFSDPQGCQQRPPFPTYTSSTNRVMLPPEAAKKDDE
jgi:hypothetical protein